MMCAWSVSRSTIALHKRAFGSLDGAVQVVVGVAVAAGKMRAGETENFSHLIGSPALLQQMPRDPAVDDAPVGLGKALTDVPSLHTSLIELGGHRRSEGGRDRIEGRCGAGGKRRSRRRRGACRLQQGFGLRRHTGLCADDLDPRGVAARCTPRRLLVGEPGEPAQVTPVRAGPIAPISGGQQFAGGWRIFEGARFAEPGEVSGSLL